MSVSDQIRHVRATVLPPRSLLSKIVGFLFKYNILPESMPGIFSINETNDYVFVDRKRNDTLYVRPLSHESVKVIQIITITYLLVFLLLFIMVFSLLAN